MGPEPGPNWDVGRIPTGPPGTPPSRRPGLLQGTVPLGSGLGSPGRPLDGSVQREFGRAFDFDFSAVRIHTDSVAAAKASAVDARAYAIGSDVVFAAGTFDPTGPAGRRLLAHELTHVVQQAQGGTDAPGPSQEHEASLAVQRLGRGQRPDVRSGSRRGFAAKPRLDMDDGPAEIQDIRSSVVLASDIEARVKRIVKHPEANVREGKADFNANPRVAQANLSHTHFRNDDERLSYAVGVYRQFLGAGGDAVDDRQLISALIAYETQRQQTDAKIVVHSPPTAAESRQMDKRRADIARGEYQAYLAEVAILEKEADARLLVNTHNPMTVGVYEQQVGAPVEALADHIIHGDYKPLISAMINFIPIVGQVKTLVEGIIGRDLVTGEEIPTWMRGLNILLAIIPDAKGIFSAGRSGLRVLAEVARDSRQPIEEIYTVTRAASRMSVEDVRAVEKLVPGARPTPAQVKMAQRFAEMEAAPLAEGSHPVTMTSKPAVAHPEAPGIGPTKPPPAGVEVSAEQLAKERQSLAGAARDSEKIRPVDKEFAAKGYDVEIAADGGAGKAVYRRRASDGTWCRFASPAWCGFSLGPELDRAIAEAPKIPRPSRSGKPTERFVRDFLGPEYEPQVHYFEGEQIGGTKYGMSISDYSRAGRRAVVVEVKNIDIEYNLGRNFRDLNEQTGKYLSNLKDPEKLQQWLFLDIRGQDLGGRRLADIADIVKADTGHVYDHVYFITGSDYQVVVF